MRKSRMILLGLVAFLILAGVIGAACGGADLESAGPMEAPGAAAAPAILGDGVVAAERGAADASGAEEVAHGAVLGEFQIPVLGPRIVKTAVITLEVRKGAFDRRFQEATLVAARHGGFVSSSQTFEAEHRSGTIVLRVPAAQFDAVLGELRRIGKVKGEEISGQDVTAQFVDLESRLRNWEAQEAVLLRLMAKARSIEDSIKVQRQLQEVQFAIEEIKGQLRYLTDQTDFATVTVSVAEAGAAAQLKAQGTLSRAWHESLDGFLSVIAAVIVGLGYLVPIVLLGLTVLLAYVGYRRVRARPAPSI
jgi:hypothetical protein